MSRIQLNHTPPEALLAIGEGNPGALSVLARAFRDAPAIDPDSAFGGFGILLDLDQREIYGGDVWRLFKDVCGEDLTSMLALMRADQLGQLAGVSAGKIRHAIQNRGEGIDCGAALAAVRARLPRFASHMKSVDTWTPAHSGWTKSLTARQRRWVAVMQLPAASWHRQVTEGTLP